MFIEFLKGFGAYFEQCLYWDSFVSMYFFTKKSVTYLVVTCIADYNHFTLLGLCLTVLNAT